MPTIDVTRTQAEKRVDVSQIGVLHQPRPIPKDLRRPPANPYGSRGERPYSGKGYRAARKAYSGKGYRAPGDPGGSRGERRRPQSLIIQGFQGGREALFFKGLRAMPRKPPSYKGQRVLLPLQGEVCT
jgi:hypothetical protein